MNNTLAASIKIIVADDHPATRSGVIGALKDLLQPEKIAEAANGKEVLNHLYQESYDLILLDIRMKVMDGFETARFVKQKFPVVKIIAYSMEDNSGVVSEMMKAGCNGYLTKGSYGHEIVAAIIEVMKGEIYIDPVVRYHPEKEEAELPPLESFNLKPREIEMIKLIALGKTNRTTAQSLLMGVKNLTRIRTGIYKKTGVKGTAGITRFAMRYKLVGS